MKALFAKLCSELAVQWFGCQPRVTSPTFLVWSLLPLLHLPLRAHWPGLSIVRPLQNVRRVTSLWCIRIGLQTPFNLGHDISRNTIKAILKESGIEPAPERGRHAS